GIFRCEDAQADAIVSARAVEERFFVNPADVFVGNQIDLEHLERIAGAAPGMVEVLDRKIRRPTLGKARFICKPQAAGEHARQPRPLADPLLERFLHAPELISRSPPVRGSRARTRRGRDRFESEPGWPGPRSRGAENGQSEVPDAVATISATETA